MIDAIFKVFVILTPIALALCVFLWAFPPDKSPKHKDAHATKQANSGNA